MCGIFAVSGPENNAGNAVLAGLKKLEYRGYDSWGIAIQGQDKVSVQKDIGKISEVNIDFPSANTAIGHTRWATHGGVTQANSHPHQSGRVTLVHNGIFENHSDEKAKLKDYKFLSETDTEVIAVLLNKEIESGTDTKSAIAKVAKKITGRFSILVMVDGEVGIWAARRGSPLIIGRGKTETFIASDIPAFLEKTNVVNYLDDEEMVFVHNEKADFFSLDTLESIEKRDIEVSWKVEEAEKGDYDHFMIKEIFDQKESIIRAINHENSELAQFVDALRQTNGAYLIACGTAHKMCMAAEYFFSEISGRKINVVAASEMPYFEKFVHDKTALIAISQSGETADVLEILERGKKVGAKILSLTNAESSSIARISEVHLPIQAGPEKAVASTKAATSQMALLLLCAYADSAGVNDFQEKINKGREVLRTAASNINELLNPRYELYAKGVAEKIVQHDNLFIIGRGHLYPMALEAAIKIQEVSYIHAQGFSAGELKHGPIALIEEGTPCIVLGDDSETISNATELKARGAMIIGVADKKHEIFDEWLKAPNCGEAQAIASVIPMQILSYYLAVLRGLDPDMPRNLAKSVTVK